MTYVLFARLVFLALPHRAEVFGYLPKWICEFGDHIVRQPRDFNHVDVVIADERLQALGNLEAVFQTDWFCPSLFPAEIEDDGQDGIHFHRLCIKLVPVRCAIVPDDADGHRLVDLRLVLEPEECEMELVVLPEFRDIVFLFAEFAFGLVGRLFLFYSNST